MLEFKWIFDIGCFFIKPSIQTKTFIYLDIHLLVFRWTHIPGLGFIMHTSDDQQYPLMHQSVKPAAWADSRRTGVQSTTLDPSQIPLAWNCNLHASVVPWHQ